MIYYAVIDTNVIISALLSPKEDSATVKLIQNLLSGNITPIYSDKILEEYSNVLHRDKFKFSKENIDLMLSIISLYGSHVEPSPTGISLIDKKDLPFYELAVQTQDKKSYLVTGNMKYFPKQSFIVNPKQFMEILEKYL